MRKKLQLGFLVGCCILLLDILTKYLVYHDIPPITQNLWFYPYGGIPVFENFLGIEFSIVHATNRGAAWGALADFQTSLLVLRIVLIALLTGYLLFFNQRKAYVIPICLLITGAVGNVIDYFKYGVVIDMFKFVLWGYHYPIFNVADCAITIGIFWIIMASFLIHRASAVSS
ncbi:MAG: Lipoprotein signal peptidase [Chlamydiae bacterium]|nr:Lipoprotein signal peptidase [Chlamydiota bacterium]